MEFFAIIGLITVIWIIYDLTKYIFIDCPRQIEEEDRIANEDIQNSMLPEEFIFDRSDDQLHNKVFDPVEPSSKPFIAPINFSLDKIGAYVRLYYHLLSVYEDSVEEDAAVRTAVYRIEMLRCEIQEKILTASEDSDNAFRLELQNASNTILAYGGPIINAYEKARDLCLSKEIPTRTERLNCIYSVLDAEKILFHNFPETNSYYAKTGETYLAKVFSTNEQIAKTAQAIKNSQPQT